MENEENYLKFKSLLEYFVVHLEYANNGKVDAGYEYIEKFIENGTFKKAGQGYNGNKIQDQIKDFDTYFGIQICINVQFHPSSKNYESKRCYLNWKETDLNIIANWNNEKITDLCISNWYGNNDFEKHVSIIDLGLFDGKKPNDKLKGFFNDFYNLYKELLEMKSKKKLDSLTNLLQHTRNLILHGAPGTGKTFLAKEIAKKMGCSQDEIGFVQFHPSYDYTDFVEGLRPKSQSNGEIGFERKDGVFKEFCKKALQNMIDSKKSVEVLEKESSINDRIENFLENAIEEKAEFETATGNKFTITENTENNILVSIPANEKTNELTLPKSDLVQLLSSEKVIENGADIKAFFNRKWRTQQDSYIWILYKKIHSQKQNITISKIEKVQEKKFVFIIDEINRGELSKIFGELFFCVDPGYRGKENGTIKTQYQNLIEKGDEFYDGFFIPENVYIIGTMNDIDRSVDSMDFAFRRRFAFKEIKASENLEMLGALGELAEKAKIRLLKLNDEISKLTELSSPSSYQIGGAYFMKLKDFEGSTEERFRQLWDYHLEGLLKEYLRGTENSEENFEKLRNSYFGFDSEIE